MRTGTKRGRIPRVPGAEYRAVGQSLLSASGKELRCYDNSGKEVWSVPAEGELVRVEDGNGLVAAEVRGGQERIILVDARAGREVMNVAVGKSPRWFGVLPGPRLIVQDDVSVAAYAAGSAAAKWTLALPVPPEGQKPGPNAIDLVSLLPSATPDKRATAIVAGSRLVVPCFDGLHFLDPDGHDLQKPLSALKFSERAGFPSERALFGNYLVLWGGAVQLDCPLVYDTQGMAYCWGGDKCRGSGNERRPCGSGGFDIGQPRQRQPPNSCQSLAPGRSGTGGGVGRLFGRCGPLRSRDRAAGPNAEGPRRKEAAGASGEFRGIH